MKKTLLFLFLTILLSSCGLERQGNFNKQKYTNLKHQNSKIETSQEDDEVVDYDFNSEEEKTENNSFVEASNEYTSSYENEEFQEIFSGNQGVDSPEAFEEVLIGTKNIPPVEQLNETTEEKYTSASKRGGGEMALLVMLATLCLVLGLTVILLMLLLLILDITLLPFTIIAVTLLVAAIVLYILAFAVT